MRSGTADGGDDRDLGHVVIVLAEKERVAVSNHLRHRGRTVHLHLFFSFSFFFSIFFFVFLILKKRRNTNPAPPQRYKKNSLSQGRAS
jgi:hypothetical protein